MLLVLLKEGETAWDFELEGALRSDLYDGFYSSWQDCFKTVNCVIKGKWNRVAINKIISLNISLDLKSRPFMSYSEMIREYSKRLRSAIFNLFPSKKKRIIRNMIFEVLKSFRI